MWPLWKGHWAPKGVVSHRLRKAALVVSFCRVARDTDSDFNILAWNCRSLGPVSVHRHSLWGCLATFIKNAVLRASRSPRLRFVGKVCCQPGPSLPGTHLRILIQSKMYLFIRLFFERKAQRFSKVRTYCHGSWPGRLHWAVQVLLLSLEPMLSWSFVQDWEVFTAALTDKAQRSFCQKLFSSSQILSTEAKP